MSTKTRKARPANTVSATETKPQSPTRNAAALVSDPKSIGEDGARALLAMAAEALASASSAQDASVQADRDLTVNQERQAALRSEAQTLVKARREQQERALGQSAIVARIGYALVQSRKISASEFGTALGLVASRGRQYVQTGKAMARVQADPRDLGTSTEGALYLALETARKAGTIDGTVSALLSEVGEGRVTRQAITQAQETIKESAQDEPKKESKITGARMIKDLERILDAHKAGAWDATPEQVSKIKSLAARVAAL